MEIPVGFREIYREERTLEWLRHRPTLTRLDGLVTHALTASGDPICGSVVFLDEYVSDVTHVVTCGRCMQSLCLKASVTAAAVDFREIAHGVRRRIGELWLEHRQITRPGSYRDTHAVLSTFKAVCGAKIFVSADHPSTRGAVTCWRCRYNLYNDELELTPDAAVRLQAALDHRDAG
jgi:hypothetical protein